MAVDVASVYERELETPRQGGGKPRSDRIRGGLLAIWSGLALLYLFIPACGDFINAALLGTPRQFMIGNVIQSKFLRVADYPEAAALSFILMALILIGVFAYSLVLGTRNLTEAAG